MDNNNKDLGLSFLNFAKEITPIFLEVVTKDSSKPTKWGQDNLYPNFLLKLANKSAIHKGILSSKSDYIFGDGLVDSNGKDISTIRVNPLDTLGDLVQKLIRDYVIFNTYAVEVVYNVLGQPFQYYHVPMHKIRPNKDKSKFFVSDDWMLNSRNLLSYDRFIPNVNEDGRSKVFYYSNYTPSVNNIFAEVDYSGAIESIVSDMLINEFFQNNIQAGFSAGHIISTFSGGVVSEEVMRIATKKFENSLSGVNGTKFILEMLNPESKPMSVQTINTDDYAGKLIEVIKKTERNILAAHQGTSSLLFGIEKEGSLGNSSELENAYQIFKNNYVKNARNEITSGLNRLFSDFNQVPTLVFKDKEKLFAPVVADATKEKIFTINELRKEAGLPPIADGDKLLGSAAPAPSQFSTDKSNLVKTELTADDFEKIKDKGASKHDFIILNEYSVDNFSSMKAIELQFDNDEDVANYIIENDLGDNSPAEIKAIIKKELGIEITKESVDTLINGLKSANVLDEKNKVVKPKEKEPERKVEVMYSYEKRPDIKGDKIIPTSRAFCTKLCETEKLFSREDIQTMSQIFGYDVFKYSGGFYTNSDTGKTTNYCRHYFKRVQVIRKENKNG
ncbi:hypothetical protein [Pedobacter sp. CFBP9032]|uniref:hypothetical protein n=1 Tax=Pedobacter sp. CFBP9032 TaxID=3096539 RepID=UPI002A69AFDC|nr:hypothetical protein [Pedobacter sp. CFBP9032]MDY0906569.1 hypothetical protein [Pedobacter sp. CFBP9032]